MFTFYFSRSLFHYFWKTNYCPRSFIVFEVGVNDNIEDERCILKIFFKFKSVGNSSRLHRLFVG